MARPLKKPARLTMRVTAEMKQEIQDEATAAGEDITAIAERALQLGLDGLKHVRRQALPAAVSEGAAA